MGLLTQLLELHLYFETGPQVWLTWIAGKNKCLLLHEALPLAYGSFTFQSSPNLSRFIGAIRHSAVHVVHFRVGFGTSFDIIHVGPHVGRDGLGVGEVHGTSSQWPHSAPALGPILVVTAE